MQAKERIIRPSEENHNPSYRELVEGLRVGDTFVIMGLTSSGVCSRLYRHWKRAGFTLTTRKLLVDGQPGVRVKRVQ